MIVQEFNELILFWGACEEGYNWAYRDFGPDGDARRIYELCEHPDWIEWLLDHCAGVDRHDEVWDKLTHACLDVVVAHYRNPETQASQALLAELDRFEQHRKLYPRFDADHVDYHKGILGVFSGNERTIVERLANVTIGNPAEVRIANLLYGLPPGEPYAVTLCEILRDEFPWKDIADKLEQQHEDNCR